MDLNEFIFSTGRPFENYFSQRRPLKINFSLEKALFPGEGILKFIFSLGWHSEIYFFLKKGSQIFFLDFLRPHPQIINGCPLKYLLKCDFFRIQIFCQVIHGWMDGQADGQKDRRGCI